MISIVIPLYNKAGSIARTLLSVQAQTFQDYEVVIVDDGSTDGSAGVVRSMDDSRIRLFSQTNAGVSAARNRAIAEARGEYIAFLDADDEWRPDYLALQMSVVKKYPQCDVYATHYDIRSLGDNCSPAVVRHLPFQGEDGVLDNYFLVACCSNPPLFTSAILVRKTAIQAVGGFPVGVRSGEDLLTWARLAVRYRIAYSRRSLAIFVFDQQLFNDDQRKRAPELIDVVGQELTLLYRQHKDTPGLKTYVALWHKMRARIFIQKRQRGKALAECVKSLRYGVSLKVLTFVVMALLPYSFSNELFHRWG